MCYACRNKLGTVLACLFSTLLMTIHPNLNLNLIAILKLILTLNLIVYGVMSKIGLLRIVLLQVFLCGYFASSNPNSSNSKWPTLIKLNVILFV